MPSSNKTRNLGLNKWLGSDKPKKDDFNADNALLDMAVHTLRERMDALEQEGGAGGELTAHLADGTAHVSEEDRARWNNPPAAGGPGMGTYTGNGQLLQKIVLGYRPRFGLLYGVNKGVTQTDWDAKETRAYSGFFGEQGCSRNIETSAEGFTVFHNVSRPVDGCSFKYNESGVVYVYVSWV